LIEVFRKLFNTKNYDHQGSTLGGLSCNAGFVGISQTYQSGHIKTMEEDK
jgi:hypothetical protein